MTERISKLREGTKFTGDPIETIIIITVATLTLIVALSWNNFATRIFNNMVAEGDQNVAVAQFWYAVIVTVATIIVIFLFSKIK